jgi:hypothetical protein
MAKELNNELQNQKTAQEAQLTEAELDDFEITEEDLEEVTGGQKPTGFVKADYPRIFAKFIPC